MKFIHITDTHLMPPSETLCALDPAARLNGIVDAINRLHADASFVVHTGDLSYHGLEPAYHLLQQILDRLTIPYHLLIGNHDSRDAFKRVFKQTPLDPAGFVQYVVPTPVGAFVMLDSVEDEQEHGVMCEQRMRWLEATLNRLQEQPVFLFIHHPPFDVGIRSLDASKLKGFERFGELVLAHGHVRHLFYGHVHRAIAGSWHGIAATTLPGTNHQVALYLGRELEMIGSHEASAYGVCLIDAERVTVHYQDPFDTSARFVLTDPRSKHAATVNELVSPPSIFDGAL